MRRQTPRRLRARSSRRLTPRRMLPARQGRPLAGPATPSQTSWKARPHSCLSLHGASERKQRHAQAVCREPGIKGAAPSDAPAAVEQAASDASAAAPKGLGEAAGAVKEAASGAAETVKDAAPSNPFAGFFGGGPLVLESHAPTLCSYVSAVASVCPLLTYFP